MSDSDILYDSDEGEDDFEYDSDFDMGALEDPTSAEDDGPSSAGFEVLTPADLIATQLKAIEEVNTIFQISSGTARILLSYFNWDKERLLERYYDGDPDKLFQEAQVINPLKQKDRKTIDPEEELECGICCVDYTAKEMTGLDCEHTFCGDCWNSYLHTKIMELGTAVIECPEHACPILVDELTVSKLIQNEAVLRKYQYLVAKGFVHDNKHIKWCPSPGCDNAIHLGVIEARPVKCHCGHEFCFQCGESTHDAVRCEMLSQWLKKCEDDSETSNWISANTKECPKCKSTIEKNGGCNHMVCRSTSCKYEFCWVCLGPWEPHGSSWYNCNRFDEKDAVQARGSQKKSRMALERYLFYFNRYANHEQSRRLEAKLVKLVEQKQRDLQAVNMSWIEVQFLSEALATLQACRSTLKYTYVFAYYLQKNNQGEIFESNQKDLEMATEKLSGYLEGDATADELTTLRQKVLDMTSYCDSRRRVLLDHVKWGHEHKAWEYQPANIHELMMSVYGS